MSHISISGAIIYFGPFEGGWGGNHYQSKSQSFSFPNGSKYLVDMVQFGARPSSIIRLFAQPFRSNLHAAPTGLTAAGPVGPFAELAVGGAGDDAGLFDVTWVEGNERRAITLVSLVHHHPDTHLEDPSLTWQQHANAESPSLRIQIKCCRKMTHTCSDSVKITAEQLPYDLLRIHAHHISAFPSPWQLLFNWQ